MHHDTLSVQDSHCCVYMTILSELKNIEKKHVSQRIKRSPCEYSTYIHTRNSIYLGSCVLPLVGPLGLCRPTALMKVYNFKLLLNRLVFAADAGSK